MADVTVLGAGIFGLAVAWQCQRRGARVRVIDPMGPGAGASGGTVGALAPHTPDNWNDKKAFQFESLLMAPDFWAEIADVSGLSPGYGRMGRVQPVKDERMLALSRSRAEAAREHWQGEATWEVLPVSDDPFMPVAASGFVVRDTLSARVHPRRACAAIAGALHARGADIVFGGAFKGRLAGAVVHASGLGGLEALNEAFGRVVGSGVKGQSALLQHSAPRQPQIFADGVHIVPHDDGTVAIGSTSEADYGDPTTTDARLDDVIARARHVLPALRGAKVVERWAGVRPRAHTRGRGPILGAHPLEPGQFIANGGFKIGFGIAPKVGQVMADLILDGKDTIPAAFRPDTLL